MSERLTDEELALLEYRANEIHVTHHTTATAIRKALAELRTHRSSALTAEEREALRWLLSDLRSRDHRNRSVSSRDRAIEVITRLTAGKP